MDQSVRRAAGRPPVPPDRIAAMAPQIVDAEGAEALSMRALAECLGSGTATLYRHFRNLAGLVAQVVEHMFGLVEPDDQELASTSWQQSLRVMAHAMFRALGRHGYAARLLVEQIPGGPNVMALRERCVAVLLKAGFEPSPATHTCVRLARYVCGLAIFSFGLDLILTGLGASLDQPGSGRSCHRRRCQLRALSLLELAIDQVMTWEAQ